MQTDLMMIFLISAYNNTARRRW